MNAPMLRAVAERVRQDSITFNQCEWLFCIAGHACAIAGDTPFEARGYSPGAKVRTGERGEIAHVQDRARQLLGLTHAQSVCLFDALPGHSWPVPFNARWETARATRSQDDEGPASPLEREVCADLLDWLADRADAGLPIDAKPTGPDSWVPR